MPTLRILYLLPDSYGMYPQILVKDEIQATQLTHTNGHYLFGKWLFGFTD